MDITGVGVKAEGKRHFYLSIDGMPEEVVFEPLNEFVSSGGSKRKHATEPGHVSTPIPRKLRLASSIMARGMASTKPTMIGEIELGIR